MSKKNKESYNLLFTILKDSLWGMSGTSRKISEKECAELWKLAEKQAVSGMVFGTLTKKNISLPEMRVFEAFSIAEQIKQQGSVINGGVKRIVEIFDEANVDYVIVKGQVVASYYKESLLRQSGDVDYYCDSENFEKSLDVASKSLNVEIEDNGSSYHVHFDHKGVTYEGHFALVNLYNKVRKAYFQQLLDKDKGTKVDIDGCQVKTLSPTLHVLYIFIHLYSHLTKLGVGLRQFCDMAVMLRNCHEQIEMDELRKNLENLGMERAYKACGTILVDQLGITEKELGYTLTETDRKYGKRILDVVMYRGNMGHYNKRTGFRGWKHKVESMGIKLAHFAKFAPLAPKYSCGWLMNEMKKL